MPLLSPRFPFQQHTKKIREREKKKGLFLTPLFRHFFVLAVGVLCVACPGTMELERDRMEHGTWKAAWFPHLLVCEFEIGMKS